LVQEEKEKKGKEIGVLVAFNDDEHGFKVQKEGKGKRRNLLGALLRYHPSRFLELNIPQRLQE